MDVKQALSMVEWSFSGKRFVYSDEKHLQAQIGETLNAWNIPHTRECRLSDKDIIDFVACEMVGIEIKIKGSPREIYKQVVRYAEHPNIHAILLLTNKTMALPKQINNKTIKVINLGRAWL